MHAVPRFMLEFIEIVLFFFISCKPPPPPPPPPKKRLLQTYLADSLGSELSQQNVTFCSRNKGADKTVRCAG